MGKLTSCRSRRPELADATGLSTVHVNRTLQELRGNGLISTPKSGRGFDHILNWKLQLGSHPLPGKEGGTCINEAAIVAAGFAYQPVRRVEDMPECFSRPICKLAMQLNDEATDKERQLLLPFVTRLACADAPEVERERAAYIQAQLPYPFTFQAG